MNQLRTWMSAASRIMHEAVHIAKKGSPEETAIAINLMNDATLMIDLCLEKKIPSVPPECHDCPHQDTAPRGTFKVINGPAE